MTNNKNNKKPKVAVKARLVMPELSRAQKRNMFRDNKTVTDLVVRAKPSASLKGGLQVPKARPGKASLPQFTIAQVDAFCPEAFGVKVPDDATAPSCVAFSRDEVSLNTTAAGGIGIAFRYNPVATVVFPATVSSSTWTWPAAFGNSAAVSNSAALQSNFNALRTVAHGVKITTRQSAFNASGFVHVALVADSGTNQTTWSYPTSISAMEYAPYYRRIPIADLIEDEVLVMNKYTDHTAFRYIDPNHGDNNSTFLTTGLGTAYDYGFPTSGWMAILVWVEGPASITSAVDVEYIHHYECLTQSNAGIIAITKAAPCSPAILAATSYVVEHSEPISATREDEDNIGPFWRDVSTLFTTGLRVANGVVSGVKTVTGLMSQLLM